MPLLGSQVRTDSNVEACSQATVRSAHTFFPLHPQSTPSPVLLLILKAPRPGTVKTRLAADIGPAAATALYRHLVERQLAALPPDWPVEIHHAPSDASAEMRIWLGPTPTYFPQSDGSLTERLISAASTAHTRRPNASLLFIGGDCPTLDRETLHATAHALATHDVVLGPATDGGYYLIGLRRPEPTLFTDIPWSTEHVLTRTLEKISTLGLTHILLPPKDDIDTLADLRRHPDLVTQFLKFRT